jgi:hypothetical protein
MQAGGVERRRRLVKLVGEERGLEREAVDREWVSFKTLVSAAEPLEVVRWGAVTREEAGGQRSAPCLEEGGVVC